MKLAGNQRIIRIANDRVYFTPEHFIPLSQTNLPPKIIRFRPNKIIHWTVEITGYQPEREAIRLRVIDYHPSQLLGFATQTMKHPLRIITFTHLHWHEVEPLLSFYHKIDLQPYLVEWDEQQLIQAKFAMSEMDLMPAIPKSPEEITAPPNLNETWQEIKQVPFEEVHFDFGKANVRIISHKTGSRLNVELYNPYLVPEFNWVKRYFARILKTERCQVVVNCQKTPVGIQIMQANSPEIGKIDDRMIEIVRRMHALDQWNRQEAPGADKRLFTSDEIQEYDFGNEQAKPSKPLSDVEMLQLILTEMHVRNAAQLEYLSGKLQATNQRIRFTLKPISGFLFFIQGEKMCHHCWELLDSHATYVWTFDPAEIFIEEQIRRLEGIINLIRENGRLRYRQWVRQNRDQRHPKLTVIEHTYANSPVKDAFPVWRQKLESILW